MKGQNVKAFNTASPNKVTLSGFDTTAFNPSQSHGATIGSLRRQTLVALRWAAILGQAVALVIVSQILGFDFPLIGCSLLILASALVNLGATFLMPLDRRVSDFEAYMQLGFDLWQLAGLLWLTGGISNPFAVLFLAPVVTAATTLSRWVVLTLGGMAMMLSFSLVFIHQPLPWSPAGSFDLALAYKLGIWIAIFVGATFTSLYAWRTTSESRKMAFALATAEALLAQEQKLSALGGLAAAAAHELGTPLATIQVVAKEMSRDVEADSPLAEDAALLLSQAQRCREILEQLSRRGDEGDIMHDVLSPEDLLEEAAEPYIHRDKDIIVHSDGTGPDPILRRQPELLYALKNYIDNAVDFAESRVELSAKWNKNNLIINIDDDGEGFDSALMARLGQPYASKRDRTGTAGGLGLGIFISTTFIERTGGSISYSRAPIGGARVQATWPRDKLSPLNET